MEEHQSITKKYTIVFLKPHYLTTKRQDFDSNFKLNEVIKKMKKSAESV